MNDVSDNLSNLSIELLCLSAVPPMIKNGRIIASKQGVCEVILDEPEPKLQIGMRVVLDGGIDSSLRLLGLILETDGTRLQVETERVVPPDKRTFPRMYGGIHVRYRVLAQAENEAMVSAWLAGEEVSGQDGAWYEPDPFMDFSGSGLKFEDQLHCNVDDCLLIELKVPSSGQLWRSTARVIRVEPIRSDEMEAQDSGEHDPVPTHHIAVHFLEISNEAIEALTTFTLKIQNALLKG